MANLYLGASVLISATAAWCLVGWLEKRLRNARRFDVPNARSSHSVPTPRGGGAGIIAGATLGVLVSSALGLGRVPLALALGVSLIAFVAAWDDYVREVKVRTRLITQVVGAGLVVIPHGTAPMTGVFVMDLALTVLWIVAMTNFYNFMDGIDGIAGLQGILAGCALALGVADVTLAPLAACTAGACMGFLVHNWHPSKIFMGDVGAATLGYVFAALPLTQPPGDQLPGLFLAVLVMWFFVCDATLTLLRRACRSERFWEPHRTHLYQRLVRAGWPHHHVALLVGGLTLPVAAGAVLAVRTGSATACVLVLCLAAVLTLVYAGLVRRAERHQEDRLGPA